MKRISQKEKKNMAIDTIEEILSTYSSADALALFDVQAKGLFCALKLLGADEKWLAFDYIDYLSLCIDEEGNPIYDEDSFDWLEDDESVEEEAKRILQDVIALRDQLGIKDYYKDFTELS